MQNVLQKTTSPTFSLFTMMFMIIFQQWECGSHQHNTNVGGNGEEKEDVYIRDYRILAVTAKDKELMRKGQSGSESTACVYHHHHPPPDGATARGAPWPPLQYAPRSLGSLLYLSIRLSPSFSGPWTRQPAHSWSSSSSCCIQLSVQHLFWDCLSCILSVCPNHLILWHLINLTMFSPLIMASNSSFRRIPHNSFPFTGPYIFRKIFLFRGVNRLIFGHEYKSRSSYYVIITSLVYLFDS